MTREQYDLLKQVLGIQTHYHQETNMVQFLCEYFTKKGYLFYLDHMNNVYVQKGEAEIFPCVISHTDTVHEIKSLNVTEVLGKRPKNYFGQPFNDQDNRLMLKGLTDEGGPSGIGGDDKAGIYVCLRLLEQFDNLKAAFFVSEEIGMQGSRQADPNFFTNVGYAIQFDAPCNALVTEVCNGVRLFDRESEYFSIVDETLNRHITPIYQSHPFTDIMQIKLKFDFACLNLSCGYYGMHSPNEVVDVEDVMDAVVLATDLIESLGHRKYVYDIQQERRKRMEEMEKLFAQKKGGITLEDEDELKMEDLFHEDEEDEDDDLGDIELFLDDDDEDDDENLDDWGDAFDRDRYN